ncbi:MAG: preprotein translocase subunit SecY, partial [Sediminibacterium sp.]|nr:preprotein translocase subunit SecY [Sediminibacterium sp.]
MNKLIKTLKNIWSIDELKQKITITVILILVYRLGAQITLPGLDANVIAEANKSGGSQGILGLFDMFAGGAFSQASILALGIMPYISASIFMQLMSILVPQVQKIQKEGESGRKKINQWTRYLTVIVTVFQSLAYVAYLSRPGYAEAILPAFKPFFTLTTVIVLTSGTLFVMWLGEKIQDKGIGNGTSIIIMVGILARLPQSLILDFQSKFQ